eukprot:GHVL01043570.1.p1 GENE.GHVL01043570.1~~GHVL01043570.1.p1  ORF type:complete len:333 (-),score=46.71 GHVL01043570.1:149-1147(-)
MRTLEHTKKQFCQTKLCTNYFENKSCAQGSGCLFAHGEAELNPLPDLTCTKLCEITRQGGVCNDQECRFAHTKDELYKHSIYFKTRVCNVWKRGKCRDGDMCRHAHGLCELRTDRPRSMTTDGGDPQKTPNFRNHAESFCVKTNNFGRLNSGISKKSFPPPPPSPSRCRAESDMTPNHKPSCLYQLPLPELTERSYSAASTTCSQNIANQYFLIESLLTRPRALTSPDDGSVFDASQRSSDNGDLTPPQSNMAAVVATLGRALSPSTPMPISNAKGFHRPHAASMDDHREIDKTRRLSEYSKIKSIEKLNFGVTPEKLEEELRECSPQFYND